MPSTSGSSPVPPAPPALAHAGSGGLTNEAQKAEGLGRTLSFMHALWAMDHALQSRSKRMEATLGVTGPQRLVVRVLGRSPDASAGEVARTLHVHPSTLTGVFRRLEERGFIVRTPDAADRRRALFRLTERGLLLNDVKAHTVEAAVRRALRRLPDTSIQAARAVLEQVRHELEREDA